MNHLNKHRVINDGDYVLNGSKSEISPATNEGDADFYAKKIVMIALQTL